MSKYIQKYYVEVIIYPFSIYPTAFVHFCFYKEAASVILSQLYWIDYLA